MDIEFKMKYFIDCTAITGRCKCELTLYLPTSQNRIYTDIQDLNTSVFGCCLIPGWGSPINDSSNNRRSLTLTLSSDSWERLEDKINELMDKTASSLKTVKEKNKYLLAMKPKDKTCVVKI